ncbi:MAG: shikimate kinase [Sphingobacteriales bacterium]|jgi:shikimate kinase
MKPIVIIGPMGSGKSSVAPILGAILKLAWVDLDTEIEMECGKSIPDIFRIEGEAVFRSKELAVFQRLIQDTKFGVIVTGGGAPCCADFWQLKDQFHSVWLNVSRDVLWTRLSHNLDRRPLLANSEDPEATMRQLLITRKHYYSQAEMEIAVLTSFEKAQKTAERIAAKLA